MRDTRAAVHVTPPMPERRLDRQWERISARLDGRPRASWPVLAMGAAAAAALATVLVVFGLRRSPAAVDAFVVASLADGRQELTFSDGSRVTVAPGGRLRVDRATSTDVAMRLEAGRARFEVKHDPGRRLAVMVADFELIDRGTRFDVIRGDDARPGIEVRVEEGEVELRDPSHREPRRLTAGEWWSNRKPEAPIAAQAAEEPTRAAVPPSEAKEVTPSVVRAAPVNDAPAPTVAVRSPETRAKAGDAPRGSLELQAARELFERGNSAKLEGRLQDAADAFDMLRLRHRADGHAALAALELGRLRLNHLSDPAGALTALQDAIKLGPRAPFREEAEARIVDAFAALGRGGECVRAREQFLARHARSVHAAAVAGKCGAR
jgi:hypothetical protein